MAPIDMNITWKNIVDGLFPTLESRKRNKEKERQIDNLMKNIILENKSLQEVVNITSTLKAKLHKGGLTSDEMKLYRSANALISQKIPVYGSHAGIRIDEDYY